MVNRNYREDRYYDFAMDDPMMNGGYDCDDMCNEGCNDYCGCNDDDCCNDCHNECECGCNDRCDEPCECECDPCNDPCDPCNNNCCDPCGNNCECNDNCSNNCCNNNNCCQTCCDDEHNCDVDAAQSDASWYEEVRRPHRPNCGCKPSEEQCRRCRELKCRIQHLDFALQEVTLYLDMHPCDCRALRYYHRIKCELDKCMALYERHCAPICNKGNENQYEWEWAQGPWPWEGQE